MRCTALVLLLADQWRCGWRRLDRGLPARTLVGVALVELSWRGLRGVVALLVLTGATVPVVGR